MAIIGIVCYLVAAFLVYQYFSSKKRMEALSAVETSTTASLREICQSVAADIGGGSFEQAAEVKGMIECKEPLESEIGKLPCVHYSMSVTRKWEEDYEEKDQQTGKMVRKTRQGSDTEASNTRAIPFLVKDDTGTITVNPTGAEIQGEQSVSRFEPHTSSSGKISFGGFSFSLGGSSRQGNRRTLGYQFSETILPVNRRVFILGSASDLSGELMIQKPREKKEQFLISLKSEDELMASSKSGMTWSFYGAIALGIIGTIFVILQFVK